MNKIALLFMIVPIVVEAQAPLRYSLRRTTVIAPTMPHPYRQGTQVSQDVEASALTCNLEPGPVSAQGFRVADPVNAGRDCEWIAPPNQPIFYLTPDAIYEWTLTRQFEADWSDGVPPEYKGPSPTTVENVRIKP